MSTQVAKRLSAIYLVLFLLILSAVPIYTTEVSSKGKTQNVMKSNEFTDGKVERNAKESAILVGGVARTITEIIDKSDESIDVTIQASEKLKVQSSYKQAEIIESMKKSEVEQPTENLIEISEISQNEKLISVKKTEEPIVEEVVQVETNIPTNDSINVESKKSTDSNNNSYDGSKLTRSKGVNQGPSGKETYYNLPMNGVIRGMRHLGYKEEEWQYSVRSDGVKLFGKYVMVAANLRVHPRGSLVETSLGTAIVCDTGSFASSNPTQLDIAVSW